MFHYSPVAFAVLPGDGRSRRRLRRRGGHALAQVVATAFDRTTGSIRAHWAAFWTSAIRTNSTRSASMRELAFINRQLALGDFSRHIHRYGKTWRQRRKHEKGLTVEQTHDIDVAAIKLRCSCGMGR